MSNKCLIIKRFTGFDYPEGCKNRHNESRSAQALSETRILTSASAQFLL